MSHAIRFVVVLAFAGCSSIVRSGCEASLPTHSLTAVSTTVHANAVDDGPCPPGSFSHIPKGADYHDDTWFTADGVAFGFAGEEDECWTPTPKVVA